MQKIYSLQYLRAFAALWVLLTHVLQKCEVRPDGVFWAGQWGVDIFFLLSGFIIFLTTKEGSSWISFCIKRIFRIYPAYLFILALYMLYGINNNVDTCNLAPMGGGKFLSVIYNILMLPMSGPITTQSLIVGQAWSTVFELYFYSLFALLLFTKTPKRYIVHLIILLCIVGYGYRLVGFPVTGALGFFSSVMGSKHVVFFIEGVLLAVCYEKGRFIKWKRTLFLSAFAAVMLTYLWSMTHTYNQILSFILSPCVFIVMLLLNDYVKCKSWWNKALSFCGDISFSIYLVHILIITIIINEVGVNNVYMVTFLSLILTILASTFIYQLVEKRFMNYAKQLVKRQNI